MNTHFHTPSFGDEDFDLDDGATSTPTSNFGAGNPVNIYSPNICQQTPPSTKRMIGYHNMSDELYQTANEYSFNVTSNSSMNNSVIQQNIDTPNNLLSAAQADTSTPTTGPTTLASRKQMTPVDQAKPAKPLSSFAIFFRDTVSVIKQQNPTCSFQELSKIVRSMWDALDPVHKGVYNKKNELATAEYMKQIKIYQQQQQLKQEEHNVNTTETVQTEANIQQQPTAQAQVAQQPETNDGNMQETAVVVNNNDVATSNPAPAATASVNSSAPCDDQMLLLAKAGSVQKCLRENCNKRAIISPDWEDEYCSNECVVIHCRNVFNAWVQSNLEAKRLEEHQ